MLLCIFSATALLNCLFTRSTLLILLILQGATIVDQIVNITQAEDYVPSSKTQVTT